MGSTSYICVFPEDIGWDEVRHQISPMFSLYKEFVLIYFLDKLNTNIYF